MQWKHLFGLGVLAGMGFTMSLFITTLAYKAEDLITHAKMGILTASLLVSVVGYVLLKNLCRLHSQKRPEKYDQPTKTRLPTFSYSR
jgi:NhaA family Na+:H+ antiporter